MHESQEIEIEINESGVSNQDGRSQLRNSSYRTECEISHFK